MKFILSHLDFYISFKTLHTNLCSLYTMMHDQGFRDFNVNFLVVIAHTWEMALSGTKLSKKHGTLTS